MATRHTTRTTTPNIIYILADDMGYGDMGCNNSACKIPTPNLDRLAARGMRFTDAHAGSSVCTPSRYNILTGRYAWRSRLKQGIVWEWDGALIEPGRETVASLLKAQGYTTACIGKWHLGWEWATKDGSHPNDALPFGEWHKEKRDAYGFDNIDFSQRIGGGPVDCGFDSYFGVDVPNFAPYTWFEDDHLTDIPTVPKPDELYGNPGIACPDWNLEQMIPTFTQRAEQFITDHADSDQPYFLYFPLTSPHSPIVPNQPFVGKSGVDAYGDFVCEVDWLVGQIMDALDRTGTPNDTLLIFTSDNGPEHQTKDGQGAYERARTTGHYSMGPLRGIKRDAWEGGHRVPFLASWPAVVPAGTCCNQLVALGDLMATCAAITGAELNTDAGEDSVSMLPLLQGKLDTPVRDYAIHHSMLGTFAVRKGPWVLIDGATGDDTHKEPDWFKTERGYMPHACPGELFHVADDIPERVNRYAEQPEIVRELSALLAEAKAVGRTAATAGHRHTE
ncbi:MAG: arylsulfatase [Verrucomicrobia bacterium]|nr:arylsulfatase [Verrucomicrobiota bacterium]